MATTTTTAATASDSARTNRSVVLLKPKSIEIQDRAPPALTRPDDVLVQVHATGICGSDMHQYEDGGIGTSVITSPLTLGHESAGLVIAVGSDVSSVKVGDHVAIEPGYPCRKCTPCKRGDLACCENERYSGVPPTHGSLCQYLVIAEDAAVKMPYSIPWEHAGCIQPLAIAVNICRRASIRAHQTVAVFGAGPIGLLTMAVARAYGVALIIAFDINPKRVAYAQAHDADYAFLVQKRPAGADPMEYARAEAARVIAAVGEKEAQKGGKGIPRGVDVVAECSADEQAMQAGITLCRPSGVFCQVGLGTTLATIPMLQVAQKSLDVRGLLRYSAGCFQDAVDLLARRAVVLDDFVTATYPLTDAANAIDAVKRAEDIKVVILNQL
ncbi:hypothetical protein PLICRDRAFT_693958 [Plicaturopsis crispa FD-325 SS-3]|nr:hypothetical protein PLICRDRAFT_693958 [Plicaturopsis crispa FD-325 SS-3]